jgi:hypothetical protein
MTSRILPALEISRKKESGIGETSRILPARKIVIPGNMFE